MNRNKLKKSQKKRSFVSTGFLYLLVFVISLTLCPSVGTAAQSGKNTVATSGAILNAKQNTKQNAEQNTKQKTDPDATLDALLRLYASKRDLTDWEAIVLGVNGAKIKTPLFATPYFKRLEKEVAEKKGTYRLVTDYARIAIAYRSHGKSATDIAGYDFIDKIIQFPHRGNQGLNAYCWSLIALYGQDAAVTEPLIEAMLTYQAPSGGFSITPLTAEEPKTSEEPKTGPDNKANNGTVSEIKTDIDLTAMAITALAPYMGDIRIKDVVDRAVAFLSVAQETDGMYKANGVNTAESVAQVIIALCACGVALDDPRFVKQNRSLLDVLDLFRDKDGAYSHVLNGKADVIATRQGALALSAYRRAMHYQSVVNQSAINQSAINQSAINQSAINQSLIDHSVRRGIFEL